MSTNNKSTHRRILRDTLAGLVLAAVAMPAAAGWRLQRWTSSNDLTFTLATADPDPQAAHRPLPVLVRLDPQRRHQRMLGFGASITDSAAWLIQQRLDAPARERLLAELFADADGPRLGFVRLTIGASDLSPAHYSLAGSDTDLPDPLLVNFNLGPYADALLPVVRAALRLNPELRIMASPWSAPGWMKDSGRMIRGSLRADHFGSFAQYLVRYVETMAAQGIPIFALTVQNEPAFEPWDYPGMRLGAGQRARLIGEHLGPLLRERGLSTKVFEWDHNWEAPFEPAAVLANPLAAHFVSAVAWHCYGGNSAVQDWLLAAFPGRQAFLTECSGGSWEPVRSGGLALMFRDIVIEPSRHGGSGSLFWSLALDGEGGPHAGGCGVCRGVVAIDRAGRVNRNIEYYALVHASRFLHRGARRIESTATRTGVANVAFLNEDDGSLVLLASNESDAPQTLAIELEGEHFAHTLPARSIATLVWRRDAMDMATGDGAAAAQ